MRNRARYAGEYVRPERRFSDLCLLLATRPDRLVAIGWWRLCGKKLRASHRLDSAIAALPFAHARWMRDCGLNDLRTIEALAEEGLAPEVYVHLHIAADESEDAIAKTLHSVRRQSLPPVAILITTADASCPSDIADAPDVVEVPGKSATRAAGLLAAAAQAGESGGGYIVPLAARHKLPRHALAAYGAHFLRTVAGKDRSPALMFGDQQELGERVKGARLWFKPAWDRRMIWSQDYVSAACAFSVFSLRQQSCTPCTIYELVLHLAKSRMTVDVVHLPRVTASTPPGEWCRNGQARLKAVKRAEPEGAKVTAGPFATVHLQYPMPAPQPRVSIVVATRDRVELLRTCVEGVLNDTEYPEIELIIADNDSQEAETLDYMDEVGKDPRVQIVRWPHPFNYSAINNYAASFASGEYLCLLNNDIEILGRQWLCEMVREAAQPGIGAVGARLLYPDRSIQHAGVAIGIGNAAGHAHRALPEGEPGYYAQVHVARGASAVTGACLLVARRAFDAVGGLDEDSLAIAYNDVDLCLKLRESGLRNIYAPAATLIHHESKSRGLDFASDQMDRYMRELAVFQQRWDTTRAVDPWHHPRLNRGSEVFGQP